MEVEDWTVVGGEDARKCPWDDEPSERSSSSSILSSLPPVEPRSSTIGNRLGAIVAGRQAEAEEV